MRADQWAAIEELIDELDIAVDATDITAAFRLREKLLAKTMRPLREFDALGLYQPTKATSTKTFLEKAAGLSPGGLSLSASASA